MIETKLWHGLLSPAECMLMTCAHAIFDCMDCACIMFMYDSCIYFILRMHVSCYAGMLYFGAMLKPWL